MRVATITLNPAVDQTVRVDGFRPNQVNRGQAMQFDPGGKGVNVASFLADYGVPTTVTGFLGADNAAIFEALFQRKGIADRFVRVPGQLTRTNVKIVDEARQQTTDINMPGAAPDAAVLDALWQTIDDLAVDHDWFVLAGNLPPGLSPDVVAELVTRLKARGRRVALDTSRDALRAGAAAGPTLVKPNTEELEQLVGHALPDDRAVIAAAHDLLATGSELVIISMGAQGALFIDGDTTLLATPPRVAVKSTVGAGDAMVAGAVAGLTGGLTLRDTARLATAFSLSAVTRVGPHLAPPDQLHTFSQQVTVTVPAAVHAGNGPSEANL